MKNKMYKPGYKVRRLGGGLYCVERDGKHPSYIRRIEEGSRNSYFCGGGSPWFPTLRDAIFHVISYW